jgi:poly(3-hydroxybutyrate) depolymerase
MQRRAIPIQLGILLLLAQGLISSSSHATNSSAPKLHHGSSKTLHFSHQDERWLAVGQDVSSVAYLPRADLASTSEPLLVLLHGVNASRTMYPWFGGTHDLRPMLKSLTNETKQGFIVAAPTQTRNAWLPYNLWTDFELESFVTDLSRVLPAGHDIDRTRIYVAGHSGAGCNPRGGLVTSTEATGGIEVAGIAFIDTCFEVAVARKLEHRPSSLPLWIMWQTATWSRDPLPFLAQLSIHDATSPKWTELAPQAGNPHVGAMYTGVELLVRQWLLGNSTDSGTPAPPSAQPPQPAEDEGT